MKRHIIIVIYIVSLILIVLSFTKIFIGNKNPVIQEVKNVKIIELNNDSLNILLSVEIFNQNSLTQKINGGYFLITKNNDIIGNAKIINQFSIEPDTSEIVDLSVSLKTLELAKNLSENTDQFEINLIGKINTEVLIFNISPNVNLPYKINMSEILTNCLENDSKEQRIIRINSTTIKDIDFSNTSAITNFTFINPYKLDFKLKSYPCKIYINNDYTGDGNILDTMILKNKQDKADGQFNFVLNNFDVSIRVFQNILQFKPKLNYETRGILFLEILGYEINFPYSYHGEILNDIFGNQSWTWTFK